MTSIWANSLHSWNLAAARSCEPRRISSILSLSVTNRFRPQELMWFWGAGILLYEWSNLEAVLESSTRKACVVLVQGSRCSKDKDHNAEFVGFVGAMSSTGVPASYASFDTIDSTVERLTERLSVVRSLARKQKQSRSGTSSSTCRGLTQRQDIIPNCPESPGRGLVRQEVIMQKARSMLLCHLSHVAGTGLLYMSRTPGRSPLCGVASTTRTASLCL